ncbi:alpha/beta hydrolase [Thalassobius vesicularis]|uniref:Alpha/beta hydrolase n=1 Tax=Thalassobius vesicularis TaxID=1294297 RepID=A0A4S3M9Q2_9RHOB|nr:alpha/beta hydrolase [Thalassobius vesicularis]THD74697.1 alpha/beta hydrolase [Thalassobius vesicularis]
MTLIPLLVGAAVAAPVGWLGWNTYITQKTAASVARAAPPRGRFVQISTGKLHYIDKGEGPVVLMIHGLGANLGNFDTGLADDLARDHRVIAIDRPGMGWSDRPEDTDASPRAQAAQVAEVIDALKLDKPLVVGHSLGGAISICLALDFPDKIRGLALLAPLTMPPTAPAEVFDGLKLPSRLMRRVVSETVAIPTSMRMAEQNMQAIFGPDPVPADYAIAGGGLLSLRPESFRNTARDYLASGGSLGFMLKGYAGLKVPVEILYGKQDQVLDYREHGEALVAKHPQIKLHLVDGGHMLPLTHIAETAAYIRQACPA